MKSNIRLISCFLATALMLSVTAFAQSGTFQPFTERARLLAADNEQGNDFSYDVAISGDTAVVGAILDSTGAQGQGSVYVYRRNGSSWIQEQELVPTDPSISKWFGFSVAISGNTIVVGAILDNSQRGSAYVFQRSGNVWTQQQKLNPTGTSTFAQVGSSVEIDGDNLLVAASGDAVNGDPQRGSVFFYRRNGNNWDQTQRLTANDGAAGFLFGHAISLDGKIAVISAPQSEFNTGSAYVFRLEQDWQFVKKLTPQGGQNSQHFGMSVTVSRGTIAVGAPDQPPATPNSGHGAVYIFRDSNHQWLLEKVLRASDNSQANSFGYKVSLDRDICIASATGTGSSPNRGSGAVFAFSRSGTQWTERQIFFNQTDEMDDTFGNSLDLSGGTAVVGAIGGSATGQNPNGSAYIYETPLTAFNAPFDFDGDGRTDHAIFRPSNGEWWYQRSGDSQVNVATFGSSNDQIVPADYTGDGKTDIAIWRQSSGEWFVLRSEDLTFYSFVFGSAGDIPAPADFDGDGKTDQAVFRPSNGTWYVNRSSGGIGVENFGTNGDLPVPADYDGDARADIAVFRPSGGAWWIKRSSAGTVQINWGASDVRPVVGDYTGDGIADVAFWRPLPSYYGILKSEDFSFYYATYGDQLDIPAPGDFDGDGKFDLSLFRPSTNVWYQHRSSGGSSALTFGTMNDRPVPSAFIR
ncbi:MAG: VCBS repeat-containing protein [Pyrinomonadaceae bacterium]|nr:VCBS repeat-containing protein [Pyrinomonadaceae bacterium]